MHEITVALALLDGVQAAASDQGIERVTAVHVRIGAFSGVVRDALLFSWDVATAETVAEGSTLVVEEIPLVVFCELCEDERAPRPGTGLALPRMQHALAANRARTRNATRRHGGSRMKMRVVEIASNLMTKNNAIAARLRERFAESGTLRRQHPFESGLWEDDVARGNDATLLGHATAWQRSSAIKRRPTMRSAWHAAVHRFVRSRRLPNAASTPT